MVAPNVTLCVQEELLLVLAAEAVATATANHPGQIDSHPAHKTGAGTRSFPQASPFVASA